MLTQQDKNVVSLFHQINMCSMFKACKEFQFRSQYIRVLYVNNTVLPTTSVVKKEVIRIASGPRRTLSLIHISLWFITILEIWFFK